MDADYEWYKDRIRDLSGLDLGLYRESQMKRRIGTFIERNGFEGYRRHACILAENAAERARFLDYVTINVTEFFRTGSHWQHLRENVLPVLLRNNPGGLAAWSCACSTGEEPLSLAMTILEMDPDARFRILATDINARVLREAGRGLYAERAMKNVPDRARERFFSREDDGWRISGEVMRHVEFRSLNLLSDPFPRQCDLIACRNVLIYFTEEAKAALFEKFRQSLKDGGLLFTGDTERIIDCRSLGYVRHAPFLYARTVLPC